MRYLHIPAEDPLLHQALDRNPDDLMPNAFPMATDLSEVALLLDVDGTILDLAPTPGDVFVPPSLHRTLKSLWERTAGALAFVSGRPVGDLDRIFSPLRLPAVGGHGAEMRLLEGEMTRQSRQKPLDAQVKGRFAEIAEAHPGIIVEDKGYSLALHYRLAPDREQFVRQAVAAIRADLATMPIELLPGKSMVEIKQSGFSKASGVRKLMSCPPFDARRPIFIGDDITDTDVFAIIPEFKGISIAVGTNYPGVDHCLDGPADVRLWLERIAQDGRIGPP
jgi:trehalose 6-phosphate phosphatase